MLTDKQFQHFRTFGFVVLRDLFTPQEVETLRAEYEAELDRVYAHAPFTGETRYWTTMLHPRTPPVREPPGGRALLQRGRAALRRRRDRHRHRRQPLRRRHALAPRHGPDPDQDCYGIKFAFYLDPVDATSGALRLIPGSHNRVFHDQIRESLESLALGVADVPAYVCASSPGDVVPFDMRCWHASHGGSSGRRMSTCVYYNNPRGAVEEAATRKRAIQSRQTPVQYGREGQPMFPAEWLANPGGSPKRQRWLNRMAELGYFELDGANGAQMRQESGPVQGRPGPVGSAA